MNYKTRKETTAIKVILMDTSGLTIDQLHKESRKVGKLGVDFHYLIHRKGFVDKGRDDFMVAGYTLDTSQEALCIVVNAPMGKLTDSQEVALKELCLRISRDYPCATISKSKKL